ncbi:hypothetical protein CIB95_08985 [Lottiidibacillus patelloidae]|uniref:GGDEF domain-containing protein n=1 Tax=Lottiidibacillus patelloidae TaxID=2670334 RepID=A0A263BT55_9BACI|nr:GGDEF domain-containing protein [Lottiidibacillus patelloidae]OZM56894.1 hypothetical protein CIB95_08985 [Lottiidibacillus patelloidae]
MNLLLDIKTICIALVIGHLFTLVLISAYWQQYEKKTTLKFFFYAKFLQAISWFLIMLRGEIPDLLSISLANTFLFVGTTLEGISLLMLRRLFTSTLKKLYIYLTIINIVGFQLIIFLDNSENLRLAFGSLSPAVILAIPAYQFITNNKASLLMKIMGYLYLLVILTLGYRGITALISNDTIELLAQGFSQTTSFLAVFLVMIVSNTGFILLLKENADKELVRMASYDDLTNVLNRRTFITRGQQSIMKCVNNNNPISFILFDIDHFKKINDKNGHSIGDKVLIDIVDRINGHLSSNHLFGRYGGDEFAILLPGMGESESTNFAENIKQDIEQANTDGVQLSYTVSLGVLTVTPNKTLNLDELYISCDKALYLAKENGRNCVYRVS